MGWTGWVLRKKVGTRNVVVVKVIRSPRKDTFFERWDRFRFQKTNARKQMAHRNIQTVSWTVLGDDLILNHRIWTTVKLRPASLHGPHISASIPDPKLRLYINDFHR